MEVGSLGGEAHVRSLQRCLGSPGRPERTSMIHENRTLWGQQIFSEKVPHPSLKIVGLPGLAGSPDLGFGFPWNGGIPRPHQVTWSQPINMHLARKREPIRGKLKSPPTPKFEKSLRRFGPVRLLCKHVTNPLKPATNCLCTPYKLGNSLGSALSDPLPLRWTHSRSPDSSQQ